MSRRPNRAVMVNITALLRARGGYPVEQVAGALQLTVKEVDELSEERPYTWDTYTPQWTREGMAREARRFFRREGRWPTSTDFRDMKMRAKGLPSWDHMRMFWTGFHPRVWGSNNRTIYEERRNALRREGLLHPTEELPTNGWVVCQRWMVQNVKLTPREILALPNALIRREGMERYGLDRMVSEGHAEHVATDDFGTLWRFPGESKNQPLMMLEVVNSTPEPDGTFAHYFLRVPPTMTVPRQATAWTFDVSDDSWKQFKMAVET